MHIISTSVICAARFCVEAFYALCINFHSFIYIYYILNKHTGERWKEENTDRNLEGEGEKGGQRQMDEKEEL